MSNNLKHFENIERLEVKWLRNYQEIRKGLKTWKVML
jgi:hypothetical protein